jgi:hypothetical protein
MRERSSSGGDKWFRNGNADVDQFFSARAAEIFCCGEFASGNIVGEVGSTVLTTDHDPLYQQTFLGGDSDPLGAGFADNSFSRFEDQSDALALGTSPFAVLVPFMILDGSSGGNFVISNWDGSAGIRVRTYQSSLRLQASFYGTEGVAVNLYTTDGPGVDTPSWFLLWRSNSLGYVGITPSWETESSDTFTTSSDFGGAGKLTLGAGYDAVGCAVGSVMPTVTFWSGAPAETIITNRGTEPAAWWAA